MADKSITQTIRNAEMDAKSLSDFVSRGKDFRVYRRLAPTIHTLDYYLSSLSGARDIAEGYILQIPDIVNAVIDNTAIDGGVVSDALVVKSANSTGQVARTQRDKNSDIVHINDFNPHSDGITDDSEALQNALDLAESTTGLLVLGKGQQIYIDAPVEFSCSIDGGEFHLGSNAEMKLVTKKTDDYHSITSVFINKSNNPKLQALLCTSDDRVVGDYKGNVLINSQFYGFLRGVSGQYLKSFSTSDNFYAESENTDSTLYVESHCAANNCDLFVARGVSKGGVLGFASGANTVKDIYSVTVIESSDHGVYSSSPTGKQITIFDNCKVINTGGTGLKCFSNGELHVNNAAVSNAGKTGMTLVADKVFVKGGVINGCGSDGLYQAGKNIGAGVNTFSLLSIDGLSILDAGRDGVRVFGPDVLDKITVRNSDISASNEPLSVKGDATVTNINVINSYLECKSPNISTISVLPSGGVESLVLQGVHIVFGDSGTSNPIECLSNRVILRDILLDFDTAPRLIRSRRSDGVIYEMNVRYIGNATSAPLLRQDSGRVVTGQSFYDLSGNSTVSVAYSTAQPTTGAWRRGSIVYNISPTLESSLGWVCVQTGSPGTWRAF